MGIKVGDKVKIKKTNEEMFVSKHNEHLNAFYLKEHPQSIWSRAYLEEELEVITA